jgi:hypothetical protein
VQQVDTVLSESVDPSGLSVLLFERCAYPNIGTAMVVTPPQDIAIHLMDGKLVSG